MEAFTIAPRARRPKFILQEMRLAREDSIRKLRQTADYLDYVWHNCGVFRGMGKTIGIVGEILTEVGKILEEDNQGAGASLQSAGHATTSVGEATDIITSIVEMAVSSIEVLKMSDALDLDRDLVLKLQSQLGMSCGFDSDKLKKLSYHVNAATRSTKELKKEGANVVDVTRPVFSAIDLGQSVTNLIRNKGSGAGRILRDKANELEKALEEADDY